MQTYTFFPTNELFLTIMQASFCVHQDKLNTCFWSSWQLFVHDMRNFLFFIFLHHGEFVSSQQDKYITFYVRMAILVLWIRQM